MQTSGIAAPPPMSRRARNKARLRAAILDASLTLFVNAGVQATTMDQIALLADVGRATLFTYFKSKSEIVDTLVAENDEGFFVALEAWRGAPALSTGERMLGLFAATAFYLRKAPLRKRTLIGLSWTNWAEPAGVDRQRRMIAAFRALLEDGAARGDLSPTLDIGLAAGLLGDAYIGLVRRWWVDESADATHVFEASARLLAAMIAPGASLPAVPPRPPILGPKSKSGL